MASIINLHLQYRLWIAEMNADINVLRIFDDYLLEIGADNSADSSIDINNYKKQFIDLRKEIDELRHEMHLNKMKLGAAAKDNTTDVKGIALSMHHTELKERYLAFRKTFDATKKQFQKSENVL